MINLLSSNTSLKYLLSVFSNLLTIVSLKIEALYLFLSKFTGGSFGLKSLARNPFFFSTGTLNPLELASASLKSLATTLL